MRRRVTVCQLHDAADGLESDWAELVRHVGESASDLVVLPEMPFASWVCRRREVEPAVWDEAVEAHAQWLERFDELVPAAVVGSRPVSVDGVRSNEAFTWDAEAGYRPLRHKVYLPDEPGFWEASWYRPGANGFAVTEIAGLTIGLLVCSEIWLGEHARELGRRGAHAVVVPRATPAGTTEKWLAAGRVAAVVAGAYCLSSNRGGVDAEGGVWGGAGWILEPEEGELMAATGERQPFVTGVVDTERVEAARRSYPRYMEEPRLEGTV